VQAKKFTEIVRSVVADEVRLKVEDERTLLVSAGKARYLRLGDGGVRAPGMRADINVIDPQRLHIGMPQLVRDLPAGGRRFLQKAHGYVGTWVNGMAVTREGEITQSRPGRLVRMRS